jgi:hypothetical protein
MEDGTIAGEKLWETWKNTEFEVTSDLLWLVLQHRLTEVEQDFTIRADPQGRRWCKVDLTEQSVKRRGSIGINGLMMAAIGICSARGVLPTAELFHQSFGSSGGPQDTK